MGNQNKAVSYKELQLLSNQSKINILRKAKDICLRWRVDILDCSKSFFREKLDIDFEEAINKLDENRFLSLTIIIRDIQDENHIEICLNDMGVDVQYFIWIYLDLDKLKTIKEIIKIVNKVGSVKNEN